MKQEVVLVQFVLIGDETPADCPQLIWRFLLRPLVALSISGLGSEYGRLAIARQFDLSTLDANEVPDFGGNFLCPMFPGVCPGDFQ